MSVVKIYTTSSCPFCVAAKRFLSEKGLEFEEINLTGKSDELMALKKKTGLMTVPQIFINENLIGGYTDLRELESKNELDAILRGEINSAVDGKKQD